MQEIALATSRSIGDVFWKYDCLIGGFIWDWIDQVSDWESLFLSHTHIISLWLFSVTGYENEKQVR